MIIGPLNGFKSKAELRNMTLEAPAILEKAGVKFALMTDAPVERIGSLFDDVRADFNIFNGDPFDFRSKIVEVYIEGEKIFEI